MLIGGGGGITDAKADVLCFEDITEDNTAADDSAISSVSSRIIDTDILYVLFTSGSTGIPKGVIINHRAVIDFTEWAVDTFHFDDSQIIGNQASFHFDMSVFDIYITLKTGSTMHIIPQRCFTFPVMLMRYFTEHKINTIIFVPTMLCRVADMKLLDKFELPCLKNILFIGEVMPAKYLNMWMKKMPDSRFANLYGPTETTMASTYYIVNRQIDDTEAIPIGRPCGNTDIIILNEHNEPASDGEIGELCIRGSSLSYGYYNNPEKTAEVFVQNPLNTSYPERIYRTGDLAHYNKYGEIMYDGRKDFQVKHSGHRIELGEIETAVSSLDGIEQCCCLHERTEDKLILFYSGSLTSENIRMKLSDILPGYMLPNVNVRLDNMPLNLNGKIDRVLLCEKLKEVL